MEDTLDTVLQKLEQAPADFALRLPGQQPVRMKLSRPVFLQLLVRMLGKHELIRAVPTVIAEASNGQFDAVQQPASVMAAAGPPAHELAALGLRESVQCKEEWPFNRADRAQRVARETPRCAVLSTYDTQQRRCSDWRVAKSTERESQAITSSAPILFMSGRFDPIVMPEWSDAARSSLPQSRHLTFENAGHGALHTACGWEAVAHFIAQPYAPTHHACTESLSPPRFAASSAGVIAEVLSRHRQPAHSPAHTVQTR